MALTVSQIKQYVSPTAQYNLLNNFIFSVIP